MGRRRSWQVPALLALILFLGELAANFMPIEIPPAWRPWLWAVIILAGAAAIWLAVRGSRQTSEPGERLVESHGVYADLRRRYLTRIAEQTRYLPMSAVDFKTASAETGQQERQTLADVYVDLDTTTAIPAEEKKGEGQGRRERPLSAQEAVERSRRLVLLGDPGSGKSTFLNHLAFCLAADALQPEDGYIRRLAGEPQQWRRLLPVPVILREVAAWFQTTQPHQRKTGLLEAYLAHWLAQLGLDPFHQVICTHLRRGQAILLLDGLDEVPLRDDALQRIREMIQDLPQAYPETAILVTCRVLSYQDRRWRLETDWATYELAQLSAEKIDRFIQAWYDQLASLHVVTNPDVRAQKLRSAVRRTDLWRLASNPLLLTVMALVHSYKSELPEARSLLYEDVVDLLLWRWEAIKLADREGRETTWRQLLDVAGVTDIDMKQLFWELAYQAHSQVRDVADREATADIGSSDLLRSFRALHPDESLDWAEALVRLMQVRAGLLVESRPDVYTFPHRTFQEYLAACHLSTQPDFVEQALERGREGVYWWEVIHLAVGRLVHGGRVDQPLLLVDELCPEQASPNVEASWRDVWLAGAALLEIGPNRASRRRNLGRELVERVRARLVELVKGGYLQPRERAEAGDVLAQLGDPRPGVGLRPDGLPDIDWVEIPEVDGQGQREFIYGEKGERRTEPTFWMARYLVTYAQFQAFVDADDGLPNPMWWQGLARTDNQDYGQYFKFANRPRETVTWYQALAFCRWLTAKAAEEPSLLPADLPPGRWRIALPTEWQWEKAARGHDGRAYPWGKEYISGYANVDETEGKDGPHYLHSSSAVGLHPQGASPYGLLDMSGNVWEWCLNEYDKPERIQAEGDEIRVLRGGSWGFRVSSAKASSRHGLLPRYWSYYYGFRLVVVPSSHG